MLFTHWQVIQTIVTLGHACQEYSCVHLYIMQIQRKHSSTLPDLQAVYVLLSRLLKQLVGSQVQTGVRTRVGGGGDIGPCGGVCADKGIHPPLSKFLVDGSADCGRIFT